MYMTYQVKKTEQVAGKFSRDALVSLARDHMSRETRFIVSDVNFLWNEDGELEFSLTDTYNYSDEDDY